MARPASSLDLAHGLLRVEQVGYDNIETPIRESDAIGPPQPLDPPVTIAVDSTLSPPGWWPEPMLRAV